MNFFLWTQFKLKVFGLWQKYHTISCIQCSTFTVITCCDADTYEIKSNVHDMIQNIDRNLGNDANISFVCWNLNLPVARMLKHVVSTFRCRCEVVMSPTMQPTSRKACDFLSLSHCICWWRSNCTWRNAKHSNKYRVCIWVSMKIAWKHLLDYTFHLYKIELVFATQRRISMSWCLMLCPYLWGRTSTTYKFHLKC